MVIYQFHCERHGPADIEAPLGQAPEKHPCPECGDDCRRVWSAALLGRRVQAAYKREIDRIERTRAEPTVVNRLP
ncbi:zinc ribbon domain-containing protein [Paractinoplanes atraurantiacus]|uniref:Putative regulatory protein FmdB zinc ribbon domain-containing protein n=1 Tax=Paractinoplanes atraurantiacus TaxID=1036182 RepID=A0A285HU02_9ACTN|nr:zinc ribbon domain-containing protein [Actinoplanes atraurantiacus]SNY39147.1 hypothetical protein SAMN05421748_105316 [Actinoplanes atraurantiacus]